MGGIRGGVVFADQLFEVLGVQTGEQFAVDSLIGEKLGSILFLELIFVVFLFAESFSLNFVLFFCNFSLSKWLIFPGSN